MRTAETLIRLGGCQADLSLRWAHTHFAGFVMSRLILCLASHANSTNPDQMPQGLHCLLNRNSDF